MTKNRAGNSTGVTLVQTLDGLPRAAYEIAWSADGAFLAAAGKGLVTVWSVADGKPRSVTHQESAEVSDFSWHPSQPLLATASYDGTVQFWDAITGVSRLFCDSDSTIAGLAWSPDGRSIAIGDEFGVLAVWDVQETQVVHAQSREGDIPIPRWSPDGSLLVTSSMDGTINIYAASDLQLIKKMHSNSKVTYAIMSPDGTLIASRSDDRTVRLWNMINGSEIAVLEGHTHPIATIQFSPVHDFLVSAAQDEIRLWRCRDWVCVRTLRRPEHSPLGGAAFHPSKPLLAILESRQVGCYWLDYDALEGAAAVADARRYGNAKVVLLGDTGVGKSGLGLVLSGQPYQRTDSTHGRNVWTLSTEEAELPDGGTQTQEVILWDLAGQPGYRLVHQLHLNEVAVALIVFDSRSEIDPFSGVKYWVRALAQARRLEGTTAVPLKAYLVAGRADRFGVAVSRERIEAMLNDLGLDGFFETSAKENWQIIELTQAIQDSIDWGALPVISSSRLFDSIKQFLLEEKIHRRVLSTVDDLFHGYRRTHSRDDDNNLRASFETCIGRVESRGLIRRLHFGDLVLLQPELLDAYASAMVQTSRAEPDGLGFIAEETALAGSFKMPSSERVGDPAQEKLLLIATVEELLRHEIALKENTDRGMDLVFPSQFTRERPDAPDTPGKEVVFSFEGPLPSIYATLAVRLSHSRLFKRHDMWQNAASYEATVGGVCGIHLHELEEGRGELVLFYDHRASRTVRSQFETYVAEHLQLRAVPGTLVRRSIRACDRCGFVLPEDLIRRRLERGAESIRCPVCEETEIALVDEAIVSPDMAVAEMNRSADERRDRNAAALRLKGKIETGDYDVFLCYNSRDKKQVMAIGERLRERGILPWLDAWEIRAGTRWQKELRRRIKSIKSAAVFIGPGSPGPWQELEVEALLSAVAKRGRPIIPVILSGRKGRPRLPGFLGMFHVVDMRQPEPDPFEQLVYGITGERARF